MAHRRRVNVKKYSKGACSSASKPSVDLFTFPPSCFAFGQAPVFSATNPLDTGACGLNAKSGHDTEKTVEVGTKLQTEKIQSGLVDKEINNSTSEMGILAPAVIKEKKVAREAIQETVTTSLIVISRILKGIPQSPHFYWLRNHSEHSRKSLISSWDGIFEETVEQIHSLQADDFWINAKELWKTMEGLQTMGYNVILLRKRVVELTDVMIEQRLSKLKINRLKIKAENHRVERSRLEFQILKLQERIKKEHDDMGGVLAQVAEMEKELPKFDGVFVKLAMEPL